jgi:ATP-dependent DNA helicase
VPVVLYHGTLAERAQIRKTRMTKMGDSFPVVVTSYNICMNDRKYMQVWYV